MDDTRPRQHKKFRCFASLKRSLFFGRGLAEDCYQPETLLLMPRFHVIKFLVLREKTISLYLNIYIYIYDCNNIIYIILIRIAIEINLSHQPMMVYTFLLAFCLQEISSGRV